jgi:hypothetical protein
LFASSERRRHRQVAFVDVLRPARRGRADDGDGSNVVGGVGVGMTVATARFRGLRAVDGAGRSTAAASVKAAAAPAAEVVPEAAAAAAAAAEDEEEDGEEAAVRDFFLGRAPGAEGGREAGDDSAASAAGVSRAFLFDFIVRTRYCRTEEAFAWSLIAESTLVGANSSPALFLTLTCSDRTCGSRTSTSSKFPHCTVLSKRISSGPQKALSVDEAYVALVLCGSAFHPSSHTAHIDLMMRFSFIF